MNQIRYNIRMLNLTSHVHEIQMLNSTSNSSSNEVVPEEIYVFLGVYLSVVCFVGILGNTTALFVFFRHAHLRTRINVFIIALLINDLIMCVFGIPLSAASNFHGYFVWNFSVCVFQGFIMFFGSMSSMYILSAISLSRYIVITRQMSAVVVNNTVSATILAFCYIFGLFWSAIPFSGWTRYEYEAIGTTCSVALDSADFYVLSYNICIFVFCYLVPVITMIFCYCKILQTIRSSNKNSVWGKHSRILQNKLKLEKKLMKTVILMIGAFLLSWTPYAVVAFWRAFGLGNVPVVASGIPAILAKTSAIWNVFIYTFSNTQFRDALYQLIPCQDLRKKLIPSNDSSGSPEKINQPSSAQRKELLTCSDDNECIPLEKVET